MATEEKSLPAREYGKIILTLENVLVPEEKLSPTPSMLDGLDSETEMDLRILGCELIQMSGILLKLPQTAMATGQVLFQRFYFSKSFVKHIMEVIAMACVNLASKIEEAPRRIRDVVNVFHHIKQFRSGKALSPLILNQEYINLKNQVIKGERRILKELGFCCHVKHPHKIIVMYLQVLEAERNQALVQTAWNYMNDSFRTDVFVRYHPETIAVACIFLAARQIGLPLPSNPPWFEVFGAKQSTLEQISLQILALYKRNKPNAEKLEEVVNEVKKLHVEAKKRAKGESDHTPNSRAVSPANMDSPMTAVKKLKNENDNSDGSFGHRHRTPRSRSRSPRSPHSITNSRSYHSSSNNSRSRSRTPGKHRRRRTPSKKFKSKTRDKYERVDKYNDKYSDSKHLKDKYSSRDRYDNDSKYYTKKVSKRRSASFSPSPRRSFSPSPERRHKKKERRSRSPYDHRSGKKAKKHSNGHRDRSRSRDRHRR